MIFILGGQGFVGSAISNHLASLSLEYRTITRENYSSFRDTHCDVLINANGNSKKFLSDREPLVDFDLSVRSVTDSLQSFRFGTYVLLSSGDVYPTQEVPAFTDEDTSIDPERQSRYGLHKLMAEYQVRNVANRWIIFRMGGFVGAGLKKNAIFDLLSDAPVWLAPSSELQFISTSRAAQLISKIIAQGTTNEIINLGAEGTVNLGELHRTIGSRSQFRADAKSIRYELSLKKLRALVRDSLPRSINEVHAFVDAVRKGECLLG
jgi:nucleoside-diphosphate-sugar epimerase